MNMKRAGVVVAGSLVGIGLLALISRVSSQTIKSDAERIARGTNGVKDVNNELLVGKR